MHHSLSHVTDGIRNIINTEVDIRWSKIARDYNQVADALARINFTLTLNCCIYDSAHSFIHSLLKMDKEGLPFL